MEIDADPNLGLVDYTRKTLLDLRKKAEDLIEVYKKKPPCFLCMDDAFLILFYLGKRIESIPYQNTNGEYTLRLQTVNKYSVQWTGEKFEVAELVENNSRRVD